MDFEPEQDAALEEETYEAAGEDVYATSSQGSTDVSSTLTWIAWFTSLPGHDFYCEVHEEFIEDDFNLTGLQSQVPFWKEALEMVLDVEPEEETIPDVAIIESSAELLYGLVHQRFILTKVGLHAMYEKYRQSGFGACPRVYCYSTPVLPCGKTETPGIDTVKLYCPNCGDTYSPPSSKYAQVDGAFFGPTFPSLFFQTYPDYLHMPFKRSSESAPVPSSARSSAQASAASVASSEPPSEPASPAMINPNPHGGQRPPFSEVYVPKIYGFKVSERARSGPRMGWLRDRPDSYAELDMVDWKGRWVGDGSSGGGPGGHDEDKSTRKDESELFEDDNEDESESEEEEEEDAPAAAAAAGPEAPDVKTKEKPSGTARLSTASALTEATSHVVHTTTDKRGSASFFASSSKRRRLNETMGRSYVAPEELVPRSDPTASDDDGLSANLSQTGSSTAQEAFTELETPDEAAVQSAAETAQAAVGMVDKGSRGTFPVARADGRAGANQKKASRSGMDETDKMVEMVQSLTREGVVGLGCLASKQVTWVNTALSTQPEGVF